MNPIQTAFIVPHPPIILPFIGKGREEEAKKTLESIRRVASELVSDRPDTIIVSTPHAHNFQGVFTLTDQDILRGDFSAFGFPQIQLSFPGDRALSEAVINQAKISGIQAGFIPEKFRKPFTRLLQLDHGAMVPLYFIRHELERTQQSCRIVVISTPFLPLDVVYRFGQCVSRAAEASGKRIVYLASGDLSHCLTPDAPAGYRRDACRFDLSLVNRIQNGQISQILEYTEQALESAGECGTRSIVMMYGALDGCRLYPHIYSYEGPFGVGYLTARIAVAGTDYVRLAIWALTHYLNTRQIPLVPEWIPEFFKSIQRGAFVSIKKNGGLRGCIGTISAVRSNLAEEIIHNAIDAGTRDPRFDPVDKNELDKLTFSVDVLNEPQSIRSISELDPSRYGVIVTKGIRRGLLLPDLDGIDSPDQQVDIALQKARISPQEDYTMERFEVIRYY